MSITIEQDYVLNILRDFLHEEKTDIKDVDWEKVYTIANYQQIGAIVYSQTKNKLFEKVYYQQISRAVRMEKQIKKLEEALEGYEHFFLKGACLKELYPVSRIRSMGDVDFVIHEADQKQIKKRLLENGFIYKKSWMEESVYYKDNICYELHNKLVLSRENNERYETFSANSWKYVKENKLDLSYHFIYVLFHLRKHLLGHGVGLRQFMDVAVLCKCKEDLDWEWITEKLEYLGALGFANKIFAFNEKAFGIRPPVDIEPIDDEFYQETLNRIFEGGVFGFGLDEDYLKNILKIMDNQSVGIKKAKKKYIINRLFPSYEQIKEYSYLRYLKKSKILLPFAWIHRLAHLAGSKKARNELQRIKGVKDRDIQEQQKIRSKWDA